MASSSESVRTMMDLDEEEYNSMMSQLLEERYSQPLLFDVSRIHEWDPRRHPREIETDNDDSTNESQDNVDDTQDRERLEQLDWCMCGNCGLMPTVVESICCRESEKVVQKIPDGATCITDHEYQQSITDRVYLLQMSRITNSNGPMRFQGGENLTERAYRKLAYRAYTCFIHDYLGPKNRIPIPSCVVNSIRRAFPAPDNIYVGFHYPEDDGPAFEMIVD